MANWEKINKRFDEVLDSLTPSDWAKWETQKEANSILRRKSLINQGFIQEKEIYIDFPVLDEFIGKDCCLYDDDLIKSYYEANKINNPSEISRGYLFLVSSCYGTRRKCRI